MINISPVTRITAGLLLLTISILLIGDMLGLVPNQDQSKINSRKTMSESLAIQVSSEVGAGRIDNALALLDIIVKRNKEITSVALRAKSGEIFMQTDEHDLFWEQRDDDHSTVTNVQVPIFNESERWGTLEISFKALDSVWSNLLKGRSFIAMLLFIVVFGFFTYWLFLRRVLSELDPSSVIPDRVRSALDMLSEGLVILDTSERIIFINESFKKKLGMQENKLIGKSLSTLSWEEEDHDGSALKNTKMPWSILFETEEVPPLKHLKLKTTENEILTLDISIAPIKAPDQKIKGAVVTIDDMTEIEKKNKELTLILAKLEKSQEEISRQNIELTKLATRDPLTDLFNRRSLFESMNSLLIETRTQRDVLSCIMLDIDHFKLVNDNYGHAVGDKVIQIFAKILQDAIRPSDIVGRYGGEEFVIILASTEEAQAAETAERIRATVNTTRSSELPEGLIIASSFGVSSTVGDVWQSDRLVDNADKCLYVAKQTGRNKVVCYSKIDDDSSEAKESVENSTIARQPESRNELNEEISETPLEAYDMVEVLGRTVILDRLLQALKLASRDDGNSVTILTINIDTVKPINYIHSYASSEKLKKIAFERLVDIFRSSDSVTVDSSNSLYRSADSEFTAILSGIKQANITTWVVNRMQEELSKPVEIDGNEIVITATVGGSLYPTDGKLPEELLTNSSIALQKANREGPGTFFFYDNEINTLCKYELEVESQLHQALQRDELYLDFQPIISMKTGEVDTLEALVRWKHPELGLVTPDAFLEVAENAGIIKKIGTWIIKKACQQLKVWQNTRPNLKMSINLSSIQFNQAHLAEDIIDLVKSTGVSPDSIVFELTEKILLKEYAHITKIIFELDSVGFKIALDDFGTGYSSIDYLRKFPISFIKIDRSLMTGFPTSIQDISIVSALISLSRELGILVIAEGVEEESQLMALRDLECDEAQGYFISRPLSVSNATEFLKAATTKQMMKRINMSRNILEQNTSNISLNEVVNPLPSGLKHIK